MAAAFLNENLPEAIFGAPKAGSGQWASLVRMINPIQGNTLDLVQLEQNEAAFRWRMLNIWDEQDNADLELLSGSTQTIFFWI